MDGIDWLQQNGLWIAALGLVLFAGLGFGYWHGAREAAKTQLTVVSDLTESQATAWDLGYQAALADNVRLRKTHPSRPTRPTDNPFRVRPPIERTRARKDREV